MSSLACELYVGHTDVVFICHSTVKNAKLNNRDGLLTIRENQNFLEGGKLIALVVCVVSHRYPNYICCFLASCHNTVGGCWFFQILPHIVSSVEFV